MIVISLTKLRQSNGCRSLRNDEIFNLPLRSGAGPWVSTPYLLQDTSHIQWFHLPKQSTKKKQKFLKKNTQLPTNRIKLPWPSYTEPMAKRVEPSLKRGNNKINRLRLRRKKTSHIVQPWFTNKNKTLREVDLEPSAKRGTDWIEALVRIYWSLEGYFWNSPPTRSHTNQLW